MNKEILQDVIDDIYQCGEYIDQAKKLEKVLDYITNLQEKYERMKENAEILSNGYNELEQKIDKAIEYLEYQISQLDFEKDTKAKMLGSMALVLLQGKSDK